MKNFTEKQNGLYLERYENGALRESANYKDGKEDGLAEGWYENGALRESANYKAGKRDGLSEWWNESGDMVYRRVYDNDKLVKPLSTDISLQEAIDNGEISDLSLELQDLVKRAANGYIKKGE